MSVDYDKDFYEWTQRTSELIRQRLFSDIDFEHVADEIADMGRRDQREVRSRMIVLIMHLLKWQLQPELREQSTWRATIVEQRRELHLVFTDSPSLKPIPGKELERLFRRAVKDAAAETGISQDKFPQQCPFSAEQVLDDSFWPGARLTGDGDAMPQVRERKPR